jgi:hypothetical protein
MFLDRRAMPMAKPSSVASAMPMAATSSVFNRPTQKAWP